MGDGYSSPMTNTEAASAAAKQLALHEALIAIGAEVGTVAKDSRNEHHKYNYASAEAVTRKIREACHRHGVAIVGSASELLHREGNTSVVRVTQVYAKAGAVAQFQGMGEGKDSQDKGVMKANTAAQKYLLALAFNISWGDDPEATDPETGERTSSTQKKKPASKPKADNGKVARDLERAIKDMTAETLADVKAEIKASSLPADEFNRLVDLYQRRKEALS